LKWDQLMRSSLAHAINEQRITSQAASAKLLQAFTHS